MTTPIFQNYQLKIISMSSENKDRELKKYAIDNQSDVVGTNINEPFLIRFNNNTYNPIQVKFAIDGVCLMSGKEANSSYVSEAMWSVVGFGALEIKAWPETVSGGAGFIFTDIKNGVSAHLAQDVSSVGIISAAVYEDNYSYPLCWNNLNYTQYTYPTTTLNPYYYYLPMTWIDGSTQYTCNNIQGCNSLSTISSTFSPTSVSSSDYNITQLSVGAGEWKDQTISKSSTFSNPILKEIVSLRYMEWKKLEVMLQEQAKNVLPISGFPGDKSLIDLGSTPRITSEKRVVGAVRKVKDKPSTPKLVFARLN